MNTQYVQSLRHKLQKRVRRLNSVDQGVFVHQLKQFFAFLRSYETFEGLIEELMARQPGVETIVAESIFKGNAYIGDSEEEHAAISYLVLEAVKEKDDFRHVSGLMYAYCNSHKLDECLESFREVFLEPFYEYLDEHLDDQRLMLNLLWRYKHHVEWFNRDTLYAAWDRNTEDKTHRGEKDLGLDLYAYLFGQGVEFHIEPWSESGVVDLIGMQKSDDPLLCDVKVFHPGKSKGKTYIRSGFHQLHTYLSTFNEAVGYLVIFNTGNKPLTFNLKIADERTPRVVFNHKTVFLITIDLFPHEQTASKRGPLEPFVISEDELVGEPADAMAGVG